MAKTLSLMRPNITIDGRRPPPSLLAPPSPTSSSALHHDKVQPYSEKLNDRVMRKQQVLLDASVGNARKRRVLPGHVVEMLGKAAKKEEEGWNRIQDAERGDGLARWKQGDVKLVNGPPLSLSHRLPRAHPVGRLDTGRCRGRGRVRKGERHVRRHAQIRPRRGRPRRPRLRRPARSRKAVRLTLLSVLRYPRCCKEESSAWILCKDDERCENKARRETDAPDF